MYVKLESNDFYVLANIAVVIIFLRLNDFDNSISPIVNLVNITFFLIFKVNREMSGCNQTKYSTIMYLYLRKYFEEFHYRCSENY